MENIYEIIALLTIELRKRKGETKQSVMNTQEKPGQDLSYYVWGT